MLLRVTVDIFSGRPNPVIELKGDKAKDALQRLQPVKKIERADAVETIPAVQLGYRGLIIEQVEERSDFLPDSFRLAHGELFGENLVHLAADSDFEEYLFETADLFHADAGDDFKRRLKAEMVKTREARKKDEERPIILPPIFKRILKENKIAPCAPLYEPVWWNDSGQRQWSNNCYNYASNYRTDTFAQPGLAAGAMYSAISVDEVKKAALADGLEDAPTANNTPPAEGHLVALVIDPGWDFHWYRMNRNCSWSHKPGGTEATNLDNAGARIVDPRIADRGSYTEFAGFMIVRHGHIKLK